VNGNTTLGSTTIASLTKPLPCQIGGYVIAGNGGGFQPIICTMRNVINFYSNFQGQNYYVGVLNNDYGYIIVPGYSMDIYRDPSFGRSYSVTRYDNTSGTSPLTFFPNYKDVGSWKLYYMNTEVLITVYRKNG
jgi:hypothetical protein